MIFDQAAAGVAAAAVAPAADGWQRMMEVEKGGRAKAASGEVLGKREVRRRRRGRWVWGGGWGVGKEEAAEAAAIAAAAMDDRG